MASFLGKKISLISKAGIRYEGILYTIDQTAFTVALSKVKSFGTEGRTTERYIAARDEVYEYIIFRGSDISDLHVCENTMYTDDSAIVKIMSPNLPHPSSPPVAPSHLHVSRTDVHVSDTRSNNEQPLSPVFQPVISVNKRFMDLSKSNDSRQGGGPRPEYNVQRTNKSAQSYATNKYDTEDIEEIAAQDYRYFREQMIKSDSYEQPSEESRRYSTNRRPNRGHTHNSSHTGVQRGRAYRGNNEGSVDVPMDDFDFELSNALMAEELGHMDVGNDHEDVWRETGVVSEGDIDECDDDKMFYDKTKSFFDNISSEVSERNGGPSERRRTNNMETFGTSEYAGGRGFRGNRWGGPRSAFRGNYGWSSSAGFIRRGVASRRPSRGQSYHRGSFVATGVFSEDG